MDSNEQQMADEWAAALSESAEAQAVTAPLEDLEEKRQSSTKMNVVSLIRF